MFAVLFFALGTYRLALPGLYGDEVLQILPALQVVEGHSPQLFNGVPRTQISIGGRPFPLMTNAYLGSLKTMLFLPIAAVFGTSVYSVRVFTLAIAALAVVLTYQFTTLIFSRRAAVVSTALLVLDQSFILRTKVDWGPNALAITCKMAALVMLCLWWKQSRRTLLGGGGFVLGLGLYNKADFSWVLAALLLATVLVWGGELRPRLTPANLITFAGSFVAGAAIFIAYNVLRPLGSFRLGNPGQVPWWHPAVFRQASQQRLQLLWELLNGTSMNGPLGMAPGAVRPLPFGTPMGLVFVGALLVALLLAFGPRREPISLERPLRWLLLAMCLFFLFATLTPVGGGHHHIINIYPWPHILVGSVLTDGIKVLVQRLHTRYRAGPQVMAGLVVAVLVASNLALLGQTFRVLDRTGGAGRWSDSVYTLAATSATAPPASRSTCWTGRSCGA